jgi:orotidine-5'-phosphate decarboxylase
MQTHAADRLIARMKLKRSLACVGLDPVLARVPAVIRAEAAAQAGKTPKGAALALLLFSQAVIDAVADQVAVVKPQSAFYEIYGEHGWRAMWETVRYARSKDLAVIVDAKRGDIGTTADAYSQAFFGYDDPMAHWADPGLPTDFVTINPYLGSDGLVPFVQRGAARGGGVFVLVKTSNPSSGELQDQPLFSGELLSTQVARLVHSLGSGNVGRHGYSHVGAVVGATYPEDLQRLRAEMPQALFLVPGYGAQGGKPEDIPLAVGADGMGAVISASRSILYAYERIGSPDDVSRADLQRATRAAVAEMNAAINGALQAAGKLGY